MARHAVNRGIIARLRDLVPIRPLTRIEALAIAERQALALINATRVTGPPVPLSIIADLPKVDVSLAPLIGHSGASAWERGRWRILLNRHETRRRQRTTLMHEFKHILDHPFVDHIYGGIDTHERDDWIETVCDYFAGAIQVPAPWLKRAWAQGNRRLSTLAHQFDVSQALIQTRLDQAGLSLPSSHSALVSRSNGRYFRQRQTAVRLP